MAKPAANAEMPFLDHLEELRFRILWSLAALVLGVIVAFVVVVKYDLIALLQRPIAPFLEAKLIITHPADAFKIVMLVSFALGLVLALPVILYQLWAFLSPALYSHEKRLVIPVLVSASLLFLGGVCLSWFVVLPLTLGFLLTFQSASFTNMIRASDYFGFATSISLALGAVFELPIAIVALTALGILTPQFLHTYRRHAFVLCVVAAAVITPGGDPMSLAALTVPLYLLYELSVVGSEVVYRRQLRRQRREEAERAREEAAERDAADREEGALA
ncbi:MAG TPA: twin-arginine translocase subunit TatC [Gemmatimonadaceae bacterium]|nr:twin-arginine translocase subunit TatC [Gemmatimonadaceae bacterium]